MIKYEVNSALAIQLFDAFVTPILSYSSPIWGFTKSKDLERLNLKFCKSVLGVKTSTCNAAIYGELGRLPRFIYRYVSIIKYWLKLISTDNIMLKTVYHMSLEDTRNGKQNWSSNVKTLLSEHGFSDIWENQGTHNHKMFIGIFKQRVIDNVVQKWYCDLEKGYILSLLYTFIKTDFCLSEYLEKVIPRHIRVNLTRLRLSSHNLKMETGRHGSI